jgi:acetylglutamate kinase
MTTSNSLILIKIGGSTLGASDTSLTDVAALQRQDARPVIVHGGGNTVTEWMARQGTMAQFVGGLRVTDAEGLEVATAVLAGLVNKQLVASLAALGAKAVGLSGADGGMVQATIGNPELGYVGSDLSIDATVVIELVGAGYIPIISPLSIHAADASANAHHLLNVNADTVAGALAIALGVKDLVFLTDVAGIMDNNGRILERVPLAEAEALMRTGVVKGGMVPKLEACASAVAQGVNAHIIDGRRPGALLECLAGSAVGTTIV